MKNYIICSLIIALTISCGNPPELVWEPSILQEFKKNPTISILPDFSYAGYSYGEEPIPTIEGEIYNITEFGAIANDSIDDTDAINLTIENAGKNGGGVVLFPKGKFLVNMDSSKVNIVHISYSNIVLRGAGSSSEGTVIFSGSSTDQEESNSPWLSPFVFHSGLNLHNTSSFFSVDSLVVATTVSKEIKKGEALVEVASSEVFNAGDIIYIALRNTTDEGDLINDLMHPLQFEKFQKNYLEAGVQRAPSFQWMVEIEAVIDATHIQLKQPVRRDMQLKYQPFIAKVPMLKNVGVEHFKFESAWDGAYKHHGNREMDYGWNAINLHRVSNGWIRDIHIDNYAQTTHLVNSRNVTIENIRITGKDGHYSAKMYNSCDNLVQNINVESNVTHGPGVEGCSFGNVFLNINYKFPTPIDLHGMADKGFCPPMYNLFENITNIEQIAGGGSPVNIPHGGEYNTFWNLEMLGWKDGDFNELFFSWIWRDPIKFENELHIDCHKQYLRSNVVGIKSKDTLKKLSIEHLTTDRSDAWIYVEGLNSTKKIVPLYATQLKMRLK